MKKYFTIFLAILVLGIIFSHSVIAVMGSPTFDKEISSTGLQATKLDSTSINGIKYDIFYNKTNGDLFLSGKGEHDSKGLRLTNQIPMSLYGNILIYNKEKRSWNSINLITYPKIDTSKYQGLSPTETQIQGDTNIMTSPLKEIQ
jgi:hypothetical protein